MCVGRPYGRGIDFRFAAANDRDQFVGRGSSQERSQRLPADDPRESRQRIEVSAVVNRSNEEEKACGLAVRGAKR